MLESIPIGSVACCLEASDTERPEERRHCLRERKREEVSGGMEVQYFAWAAKTTARAW